LLLHKAPNAIGSNALLVAAVQTRNNARIVISGSLELFADQFRDRSDANKVLTNSLVSWLAHRSGVLRVSWLRHSLVEQATVDQSLNALEEQPKATYTVGDELLVQAAVEQLEANGQWTAYKGKDVQVELRRVDPYVRVTLKSRPDGRLSAQLQLPDVCGVYTMILKHNRIGHTYLSSQQQFSVRPLQHTQYERFIDCATPYYASAFSMMFGVFLFSFVFLYHRSSPTGAKQKTN
jgi:oligosaccharyltransferase complex subunit beta